MTLKDIVKTIANSQKVLICEMLGSEIVTDIYTRHEIIEHFTLKESVVWLSVKENMVAITIQ